MALLLHAIPSFYFSSLTVIQTLSAGCRANTQQVKKSLPPMLTTRPARPTTAARPTWGTWRAGRKRVLECEGAKSHHPACTSPGSAPAASPRGFPCWHWVSDTGSGERHLQEGARPSDAGRHPAWRYQQRWFSPPVFSDR